MFIRLGTSTGPERFNVLQIASYEDRPEGGAEIYTPRGVTIVCQSAAQIDDLIFAALAPFASRLHLP